ncbi:uncharacterized protein LOC123499944 [Portunus trituberculatus]|uniref:uncharacterized protein LOC123499944 n=1 Tax=Portunus trituberculatus TaxID=210409 RepID=UPI001E1CF6F2|nr:uncharacterized protein LOC123499944 [Portunus trituberculatus]
MGRPGKSTAARDQSARASAGDSGTHDASSGSGVAGASCVAYPMAPEQIVMVLSRDAFVDALEDQQVQIYVKQAHPADVQQVLARAMEFEAFLYTTAAVDAIPPLCHPEAAVPPPTSSTYTSPAGEDEAHQLSDCRSERRTRSLEDVQACSPTKACCENYGRWGHRRATCPQLKDIMMVGMKRKWAGSLGHCPAKSSPGPICVKCRSDATVLAVRVSGAVDGRPCPLVVDTGAARTFVREEVVATQDFPMSDWQLCGVTGHCTMLRGPVTFMITVGGMEEKLPVFVADMEEPCLLGLDFLVQSEACVDLGRMRMQVESPVMSSYVEDERLELHCRVVREGETADATVIARECQAAARSCGGEMDGDAGETISALPTHVVDLAVRSATKLTPEKVVKLEKLLMEHEDVFSRDAQDLGSTLLVQHSINTADSPPIKQPHRRVPLAKREEMQRMVEMAVQELVERSDSPWSSPVVLVNKKDGTKRFCVDYRVLNDVTVKDSYPQPRIDDILDALAGVQWLSPLDLKSGYHQVMMTEADKQKTAFFFSQGLWQFRVMPFELWNAPGCFERLMEKVLAELQWKAALVYLDDFLVFARTFEEEL